MVQAIKGRKGTLGAPKLEVSEENSPCTVCWQYYLNKNGKGEDEKGKNFAEAEPCSHPVPHMNGDDSTDSSY